MKTSLSLVSILLALTGVQAGLPYHEANVEQRDENVRIPPPDHPQWPPHHVPSHSGTGYPHVTRTWPGQHHHPPGTGRPHHHPPGTGRPHHSQGPHHPHHPHSPPPHGHGTGSTHVPHQTPTPKFPRAFEPPHTLRTVTGTGHHPHHTPSGTGYRPHHPPSGTGYHPHPHHPSSSSHPGFPAHTGTPCKTKADCIHLVCAMVMPNEGPKCLQGREGKYCGCSTAQ
ncbi:hypothetical protein F4779DRAFT_483852 [Xylariaceae sp. FL0662B]|nr:hypothetical protein F4779DRAFT_483852 [Xylariaceae sp. FL0662B]